MQDLLFVRLLPVFLQSDIRSASSDIVWESEHEIEQVGIQESDSGLFVFNILKFKCRATKKPENPLLDETSRNREQRMNITFECIRIIVCGGVLSLGVEVIARGQIGQQESETIIVTRQAGKTSHTTNYCEFLCFSRCDAQRLMSSVCSKLTSLTLFFELEHSRRYVHYKNLNLISCLVNTMFSYCSRSQIKKEVHCS